MSATTKLYHHGRFSFVGGSIPNAFTAYRTYGDSKNPCIVFPTCYGGRLDSKLLSEVESSISSLELLVGQLYLIGDDKVILNAVYQSKTLNLVVALGTEAKQIFHCHVRFILERRGKCTPFES